MHSIIALNNFKIRIRACTFPPCPSGTNTKPCLPDPLKIEKLLEEYRLYKYITSVAPNVLFYPSVSALFGKCIMYGYLSESTVVKVADISEGYPSPN
jgi:hypothetical protein